MNKHILLRVVIGAAVLAALVVVYGVLFAVPYNPAKDPKQQPCVQPTKQANGLELWSPSDCDAKGAIRKEEFNKRNIKRSSV